MSRSEQDQYIFLSSRIKSLEHVRKRIHDHFKDAPGFKVWVYEEATASALGNPEIYLDIVSRCACFVMVWDEVHSQAVLDELDTALRHDRPIVLFVKRGADRSSVNHLIDQAGCRSKWREWIIESELSDLVIAAIVDTVSLALRNLPIGIKQMASMFVDNSLKQGIGPSSEESTTSTADFDSVLSEIDPLMNSGELLQGEEKIDRFLVEHPDHGQALATKAAIMADRGEVTKGLILLEKAIRVAPDYISAYVVAGMIANIADQPDKVVSYLVEARQRGVNRVDINNLIGLNLMKLARYEEALEMFGDTLMLDAFNETALMGKAYAYNLVNKVDATKATLKELLGRHPESQHGRYLLANIRLRDGEVDGAIKLLLSLTKEFPEWDDPYLGLALAYMGLKRESEAYSVFRGRLREDPDFAQMYSGFGVAASHLGCHEEAIESHRVALRLAPGAFYVTYNAACAYALAGYSDDAMQLLQRARAIDGSAFDIALKDDDLISVRHLL